MKNKLDEAINNAIEIRERAKTNKRNEKELVDKIESLELSLNKVRSENNSVFDDGIYNVGRELLAEQCDKCKNFGKIVDDLTEPCIKCRNNYKSYFDPK